jgi:hypothetical protein
MSSKMDEVGRETERVLKGAKAETRTEADIADEGDLEGAGQLCGAVWAYSLRKPVHSHGRSQFGFVAAITGITQDDAYGPAFGVWIRLRLALTQSRRRQRQPSHS